MECNFTLKEWKTSVSNWWKNVVSADLIVCARTFFSKNMRKLCSSWKTSLRANLRSKTSPPHNSWLRTELKRHVIFCIRPVYSSGLTDFYFSKFFCDNSICRVNDIIKLMYLIQTWICFWIRIQIWFAREEKLLEVRSRYEC